VPKTLIRLLRSSKKLSRSCAAKLIARKWTITLATAIVLLLILVVWVLPPALVAKGEAENDVRSTLLQGLAGIILAGGLYFTARTFHHTRESAARLDEAHLEGARLTEAHLEKANLSGAHLSGARLNGAHLEGARLRGTDLRRADLSGADLSGADLKWAQLNEALLDGAILADADLGTAAGLTHAQIESAETLEGALLPPTIDHDDPI
jgi:hypothetical protein